MLCGMPVKIFWAAVNAALSRPLKGSRYEDWLASLRDQVSQQGSQHPCWSVMHYIDQGPDLLGSPAPPLNLLAGNSEESVEDLQDAVTSDVHYLLRVGFLGEGERRLESTDCFARGNALSNLTTSLIRAH
ncbi:acetyl-CoA synthetase-like protein [Penicillium longicatenatum]|nr:acetyl-CoA synthetase-like protein [Penicillium longicatenatum]